MGFHKGSGGFINNGGFHKGGGGFHKGWGIHISPLRLSQSGASCLTSPLVTKKARASGEVFVGEQFLFSCWNLAR